VDADIAGRPARLPAFDHGAGMITAIAASRGPVGRRRAARSCVVALVVSVICACGMAAAGAASRTESSGLKAGLVLETGGGPQAPYSRIAFAGFRRAVREFGVAGKAVTQDPQESAFPSFAYLARKRYDLVIGLGVLQAPALDAAARAYPRTRFAIVDSPWEQLPHRPANVLGTRYRVEEAAYLAGYLAAALEKRRPGRDVVSAVGGYRTPTVDPFIAGFRAGARAADPQIAVIVTYANDFVEPAKCRRVALAQIARGSGAVFAVAGGCGLGALAAARDKGVWGIGVDADESGLGPHILTSVLKRMDVAAYEVVRSLANGTLRTGRSEVFDLRNGGVDLGRVSAKVPHALVAQVERVRRQIVAGKIGPIPTAVR
jgi:basic membrane protein A